MEQSGRYSQAQEKRVKIISEEAFVGLILTASVTTRASRAALVRADLSQRQPGCVGLRAEGPMESSIFILQYILSFQLCVCFLPNRCTRTGDHTRGRPSMLAIGRPSIGLPRRPPQREAPPPDSWWTTPSRQRRRSPGLPIPSRFDNVLLHDRRRTTSVCCRHLDGTAAAASGEGLFLNPLSHKWQTLCY